VLRSIANAESGQKPQAESKAVLQLGSNFVGVGLNVQVEEDFIFSLKTTLVPTEIFAVEYSTQHFSCRSCTSEEFSLNAPKFVFSSNKGVSTFNLPPMSGPEMSALSLFFSTSASFPCAVVFDHIPGFQITASVIDGRDVALLFHADHELIHFMGLGGSANLLNVKLGTSQLDMLADQVLASAANCH
jgi:hypothetical protein